MRTACVVLLLLVAVPLLAQSSIPAGTVLPLELETGLNAARVRAGQEIHARVMQNIPGTRIHRGAHVLGRVVSANPTRIEIRFDTVTTRGERVPVTTNLRALASMMEVVEAQIPEGGADRALRPDDRNHEQIGGDVVYPDGGPVARGLDVVGEPTAYGAVGPLVARPPCRAALHGNQNQQAMWLFSTSACGLYGYDSLTIDHAGRTTPVGTIEIEARTGTVNIRSGSGLLLRVQGS